MDRARGDGRDPGRGDLRESLEERRGRVGGGFSARHRHGCGRGGGDSMGEEGNVGWRRRVGVRATVGR